MNQIIDPANTQNNKKLPPYLADHYHWAYIAPKAVQFWDRPWLVNLILWGNYRRLGQLALAQLGSPLCGHYLQIACVYGDLTKRLLAGMKPRATLDLVDIAAIQLVNTASKITDPKLHLHQQDSSRLDFADQQFDGTLLFFLLHEQPAAVRRQTLQQALRVTRRNGKVVIVDYHRPDWWHPLRGVMTGIFRWLEPFAIDFWQTPVAGLIEMDVRNTQTRTLFGGLYQITTITR